MQGSGAPPVQDDEGHVAAVGPEAPDAGRRRTIRQVSWTVAWLIPLVALFVGIVLTNIRTVQWVEYNTAFFADVWPAGLVLLGAGLLGLMAVATVNAVRMSAR